MLKSDPRNFLNKLIKLSREAKKEEKIKNKEKNNKRKNRKKMMMMIFLVMMILPPLQSLQLKSQNQRNNQRKRQQQNLLSSSMSKFMNKNKIYCNCSKKSNRLKLMGLSGMKNPKLNLLLLVWTSSKSDVL